MLGEGWGSWKVLGVKGAEGEVVFGVELRAQDLLGFAIGFDLGRFWGFGRG